MSSSNQRIIERVTVKKFVDNYIYRIDLDADYQREKIWSRDHQETLLDSILKDIDIPKLYLVRIPGKKRGFSFECIDGKQRMSTFLGFFKPDKGDDPLTIKVNNQRYTYKALLKDHPSIATKMENYELTVVIYAEAGDELVREIFRRLQLGVRLNSGERLNSYSGAMRDFIFKDLGGKAPFLRHTKLSNNRFSKQFAAAQITINSFRLAEGGEFGRARFDDLEQFFMEKAKVSKKDPNLARIRKVLKVMDKDFRSAAGSISSRAAAVTAYLFVEQLIANGEKTRIRQFAKFFKVILELINDDLARLPLYKAPLHRVLLDEFQKYISQASVESYAIRRRHEFLKRAFDYFSDPETKGKIIDS